MFILYVGVPAPEGARLKFDLGAHPEVGNSAQFAQCVFQGRHRGIDVHAHSPTLLRARTGTPWLAPSLRLRADEIHLAEHIPEDDARKYFKFSSWPDAGQDGVRRLVA